MARARRWATVVAAALTVGGLLGATGCSLRERAVMVVGHDRNGTLVVGAASCDATSVQHPNALWAHDPRDPYAGRDLWNVRRALGDDVVDSEPPPPPPPPEPTHLAEVELVAVGDPDPPGFAVVEPLREPLPERLTVESSVDGDVDATSQRIHVERDGQPDSYDVSLDHDVVRDLTATEAVAAIEEHCDDDGGEDLTSAVVAGLIATGVVGVGLAVVLVVTVRQYRRAGDAEAAAAARRSGW